MANQRVQRADRGAAGAVVADDKLLHGNVSKASNLADDEARGGVRRVALVVVGLEHSTAVQLRRVIALLTNIESTLQTERVRS